jgi:four helix bundle protein
VATTTFEDLHVWQRACQQVIALIRAMKDCREFALLDQIKRSAISVPSNIAEGHERDSILDGHNNPAAPSEN